MRSVLFKTWAAAGLLGIHNYMSSAIYRYRNINKTTSRLRCESITKLFSLEVMAKSNLLKPPENVRGMMVLNKELFQKHITVNTLNIKNVQLSKILPIVKKYLLKMECFKPVQHVSQNEATIYLNPNVVSVWEDISSEHTTALEALSINSDCFVEKTLTLTYNNFTAEDIFRAVLPENEEGFSSFTSTGHIVHVNLKERLYPYKSIVGAVLLDKVNGCRSVVNKVNMIDNTYRNFKMEVLSGENNMITKVKENKCTFELDFSTVYWNSRLCTEHEKIVNRLKPNDVLFDIFAGVGPFSIPAAKKKCIVFANDLNPEAYKWLNHNKKLNKVNDQYLKTSNKDGRDFILNEVKDNLPKYISEHDIYIAMNLPAMAVEFLNTFVGLYNMGDIKITKPITMFVYCFAKGEDCTAIAKNQVLDNVGFDVSDKIIDIYSVRTVSNMKEMMRVTMQLDEDILIGDNKVSKRKLEDSEGPVVKKCKYAITAELFLSHYFNDTKG